MVQGIKRFYSLGQGAVSFDLANNPFIKGVEILFLQSLKNAKCRQKIPVNPAFEIVFLH